MKPKIILVGVIFMAGLLFGGLKGYIYYRVSTELDKVVNTAMLFADIRYQGISSSYEGSIAVEGISILPRGMSEEITIESLEVRGDGPVFLYQLFLGEFNQSKPPEKINFSVKGLSIPLGGDVATQYQGFLARSGLPDQGGCGLAESPSLDMLSALGMYAIVVDTEIGLDVDQATDFAQIHLEFNIRGIEFSEVDIQLAGLPQPDAITKGAVPPQLKKIRLWYQADEGFTVRSLDYCAKRAEKSKDAYIDSLLNLDEKQFIQQIGFVPGPGLLEGLRLFMERPGEVNLTIAPPESLDLASLVFYKPNDIVSMLNLQLEVNEKTITDLSFTVPDKPKVGTQSSFGAFNFPFQFPGMDGGGSPSEVVKKTPQNKPNLKRKYLPVAMDKLSSYLGKKIRVHMRQSDAVRKGKLVSVADGELVVSQRRYEGNMSANIPLDQVEMVEVYRIPDEI